MSLKGLMSRKSKLYPESLNLRVPLKEHNKGSIKKKVNRDNRKKKRILTTI